MNSDSGKKLKFLMLDYEVAADNRRRHFTQIVSIRNWSVTLVAAFLGLLASVPNLEFQQVLAPMALVLLSLLLLELNEVRLIWRNDKYILAIQNLFMKSDESDFRAELERFEFQYLSNTRLSTGELVKDLCGALRSRRTAAWYSFLVAALALAVVF